MAATSGNGGDSFKEAPTTECMAKRPVAEGPAAVDCLRYYYSRRTMLEMLRDRDCAISGYDVNASQEEFRAAFGENPDLDSLRICVPLRRRPNKKVLVIYGGKEEIKKAYVSQLLLQITDKQSLDRVILIVQGKINHFAKKALNDCPLKFEIFHVTELLVNITKHVLQPKHEVLTPAEKEDLWFKYKLEDEQYPQMKQTDPTARYYGLEKGQVVKLTYTGGEIFKDPYITYRCVV